MLRKPLMALVFLLALPLFLQAQQEKISVIPVTGPLYMLQGSGAGNIGVVAHPSGAIVVDSMMASMSAPIRAALQSLPGAGAPRFLVNTHWHSDHTDGNKILGPGSTVVAHANVRPLLEKSQSLMGQQTPALPAAALPAITYTDAVTLYAGDIPVRLVHYAHAHTNGDTVVYIDSFHVIHMGDMFFNGLFPFLDVDNGGDIESWVRQIDSIVSNLPADTRIIPGHGPLAGIAELKAFRQMLADSAAIVKKQKQEGKTLAQIQAARLPEKFAPWTKGFLTTPQWLELVYRSLAKK